MKLLSFIFEQPSYIKEMHMDFRSTFVDFDIIVAIYDLSIDVETVFDFALF